MDEHDTQPTATNPTVHHNTQPTATNPTVEHAAMGAATDPTVEHAAMGAAIEAAGGVRRTAHPNPWVGAAIVCNGELVAIGATEPPGGRHAEIVALDAAAAAGVDTSDALLASTLEPCCHHGRTGPCTDRIIDAGIGRVVVGVIDEDASVAGKGIETLEAAGIAVEVGVRAPEIRAQLAPYLHHRRTGRPYVICKVASTLDGAAAAPDGTSRWITGEAARRDAHRVRAESDAIIVGAGTVRADDPQLTVRHVDGTDPRRVVLGHAPADARIRPCLEWDGPIEELLDTLGREGVVQVLVEGGPKVAGAFHDRCLVDRYVFYLAPALVGGPGGFPALSGTAAASIDRLWRGRIDRVEQVGDDVRIDVVPERHDGKESP